MNEQFKKIGRLNFTKSGMNALLTTDEWKLQKKIRNNTRRILTSLVLGGTFMSLALLEKNSGIPTDERLYVFITDMYDSLANHYSSEKFSNIISNTGEFFGNIFMKMDANSSLMNKLAIFAGAKAIISGGFLTKNICKYNKTVQFEQKNEKKITTLGSFFKVVKGSFENNNKLKNSIKM